MRALANLNSELPIEHTIIECSEINAKLIASLLLKVECDQVKLKLEYIKLGIGKNTKKKKEFSSFASVLDTIVHLYL